MSGYNEPLTRDEAKIMFIGLLIGVVFSVIWVCVLGQGQFFPSPKVLLGRGL